MLLIRPSKNPKYIRRKSYYTLMDLVEHIVMSPLVILGAVGLYIVDHSMAILIAGIPLIIVSLIAASGNLQEAFSFIKLHWKDTMFLGLMVSSILMSLIRSTKTYKR